MDFLLDLVDVSVTFSVLGNRSDLKLLSDSDKGDKLTNCGFGSEHLLLNSLIMLFV